MWKLSVVILAMMGSCVQENAKINAQVTSDSLEVNVKKENIEDLKIPLEKLQDTMYQSYGFDMLMGHFEPSKHEDYVKIDLMYADRAGMYIHKDTYQAFIQMYEAAKKDSVNLIIRSATRNFNYQKRLWEGKWEKESAIKDPTARALKILQYSSMPGTSRHHWGSDIDLSSFNNSWFEKGEGLRIWEWLEEHAVEYGFCRPYTAKDDLRPNGYQEERWHWSYMPLSRYFMSMAKEKHNDSEIKGFMGAEVADEIDVVEKYVLGVNGDCVE